MNNLDYLVGFSRQKANKALAITGYSLDTAFVEGKLLPIILEKNEKR